MFVFFFFSFQFTFQTLELYTTWPFDAFRLLISYPYNILDKLHAVSPGFVLSSCVSRSPFVLSLFCDIVSSYNLSPGFSDSIKLPCSPHAFFLVIVCLRSFCSYDSPRPSSSMKLSPSCRASPPARPLHAATPLSSLVAATSCLRFLFIHIVGVTPALFSGT